MSASIDHLENLLAQPEPDPEQLVKLLRDAHRALRGGDEYATRWRPVLERGQLPELRFTGQREILASLELVPDAAPRALVPSNLGAKQLTALLESGVLGLATSLELTQVRLPNKRSGAVFEQLTPATMPALRRLLLSDDFGLAGVEALLASGLLEQLEVLDASSFEPKASLALLNSPHRDHLSWTNAGNNQAPDELLAELVLHPSIAAEPELYLGNDTFGPLTLSALARSPHMQGIERIDFGDSEATAEAWASFADAGNFPALKALRAGAADIDERVALALLQARGLPALEVLDLGYNWRLRLGPCPGPLAPKLHTLDIRCCNEPTDVDLDQAFRAGLLAFWREPAARQLQHLVLKENGLDDGMLRAFAESLWPELRSLNLEDNPISEEGVFALLHAPQASPELEIRWAGSAELSATLIVGQRDSHRPPGYEPPARPESCPEDPVEAAAWLFEELVSVARALAEHPRVEASLSTARPLFGDEARGAMQGKVPASFQAVLRIHSRLDFEFELPAPLEPPTCPPLHIGLEDIDFYIDDALELDVEGMFVCDRVYPENGFGFDTSVASGVNPKLIAIEMDGEITYLSQDLRSYLDERLEALRADLRRLEALEA